MKQTKHTPGPWERLVHQTPEHIFISDRATNELARLPKNNPQSMANARLIAAAPELLIALQETLSCIDQHTDDLVVGPIIEYAKQVLNKATGGAK